LKRTAAPRAPVTSRRLKERRTSLAGRRNSREREIRKIKHLAEVAERERERLDAALTNMAQGLCMFDADQRLVVFNPRVAEIFKIPSGKVILGMSMRELMMMARASDKDPEAADAEQGKLLAAPTSGTVITTLQDDTTLLITHRPMSNGGFVATFEDITERLRAEERIRHLAHFDALTDLANRTAFYEKLRELLPQLRRAHAIGVLSIDVDQFKVVNDTLGHPIGDRLLKAVAARIRGCTREGDIVARLGGDEFALVQALSGEPATAQSLAARLIEAISAPYEIDGRRIAITASVGIAMAPADGQEPDILLKNADLALYRAKADGGGTYRFFEREMDARMQARRAIELDLRSALANDEFELNYQPIIDLKSGRISNCEALIRWRHPKRGMIQPSDFIPVAEETGLIVPIGEWVLRQACAEAAHWPRDVRVSVNLSPAQFKDKTLVQTIVHALEDSRLSADRLELEITELVMLQENDGGFAVLNQLRDLGIKIAMDDFGTGYSSLGYLRSFPFDKIKIDQSFIRDLPAKEDSVAIIRAVVGLSSSLGITTTAEGVETEAQLNCLRREGCSEAQGYLLARPAPATEVRTLLKKAHHKVAAVA
jgi:diguanylate cyclase (GGDEF)-like protein